MRWHLPRSRGAGGLTLGPYFDGERTPNLPDATGSLHDITRASYTPANLARAAVEGVVCSLVDGPAALRAQGVEALRILLAGGGAQSVAVQDAASQLLAPLQHPGTGRVCSRRRRAPGRCAPCAPCTSKAARRTRTSISRFASRVPGPFVSAGLLVGDECRACGLRSASQSGHECLVGRCKPRALLRRRLSRVHATRPGRGSAGDVRGPPVSVRPYRPRDRRSCLESGPR